MAKENRGFTLIELLVVVAIIGILSGIAFISISGARESAFDTQIRSELSQIRSNAEQYYYSQGGTYNPPNDSDESYDQSAGWDNIKGEIPPCSADLLDDGEDLEYQINVTNQHYVAWAPLCSETENDTDPVFYCIDSEGNAGEYQTIDNENATNCEDLFTNEL